MIHQVKDYNGKIKNTFLKFFEVVDCCTTYRTYEKKYLKCWKCLSPQHSASQTMCQSGVPLYHLQDMNTERCSNHHCKILPGQKLKEESSLGHLHAKPAQPV